MLGIIPDEVYIEREITIEPGDRLCLYTDGLTEARNEIGEQFGTDRLQDCLRHTACDSPERMLECLLQEQHNFCGTTPLTDDVTVLVASLDGP
jgi:phosphoserine phosphatase RsbU/P